MTDTHAATASHEESVPVTELFSPEEIREFDRDDVEAGRNICKMLSLFFLYTVFAMGAMTYLTWRWVSG